MGDVSILQIGGIALLRTFLKRVDHPSWAILMYSEDVGHQFVGFRFCAEHQPGKTLRVHYPRAHYGIIQSKTFFRQFGLDVQQLAGRHLVEEDTTDPSLGTVYCITLHK